MHAGTSVWAAIEAIDCRSRPVIDIQAYLVDKVNTGCALAGQAVRPGLGLVYIQVK